MSELDLEGRLERIESREEIEAVMAEYLYLADRDPDADKIAALFTEGAIWEPRGNFALEQTPTHGRAAIRELFAGLAGTMSFGAHFITNAVVDVDVVGATAHGRWHTLELLTKENPTVQILQTAWYENDFERVDGRWLIKHIRFEDTLSFPFVEGWAETRFVSLVSGERFPHPGPAATP
jgi:ketosteroid isomerase-like protein